jgi:hypothetical protein
VYIKENERSFFLLHGVIVRGNYFAAITFKIQYKYFLLRGIIVRANVFNGVINDVLYNQRITNLYLLRGNVFNEGRPFYRAEGHFTCKLDHFKNIKDKISFIGMPPVRGNVFNEVRGNTFR